MLVTHDVQEAVALADRVILIEDGRIALDENIALARPRSQGDPAFAAIEKRILDRVLQKPDGRARQRHALGRRAGACAALGRLIFSIPSSFNRSSSMSIQAINVRNQFKGKVREILRGDVVSEVDVETAVGHRHLGHHHALARVARCGGCAFALRDVPAGRLAVVRAQGQDGADELQLKPGSDVVALVKSTEVSIAKL